VEKRGEKFAGELVKSAKEEKAVVKMTVINARAFTASTLFPSRRGVHWKSSIPISSVARRGIFVESQPRQNQSPVGAAYSDDVAPERSFGVRNRPDYKDFAPTVLTGEQRRRLDFSIFGCFHPNLLVFSLFR
jgi:hypothetical protein